MEQYLVPTMEPDFSSFLRQSGRSPLDSVITFQQLRSDVMAHYLDNQVEQLEPAPTRPTSLGLANFQQAKPEKENQPGPVSLSRGLAYMPGTNSGGEDRLGKVTKPPYGPKTFPKLPSLRVNRFEPSNAPSSLRAGQLRSGTGWSRTRARSAQKRSVSFNLQFRRFSTSSLIWIGGLPGCLTLSKISNPICLTMRISSLLEPISEVSSRFLQIKGGTRNTSVTDMGFRIHTKQHIIRLP